MKPLRNHTPSAAQVATRDRLMADGFQPKGWNEYPSKSRRKNPPPDACLVMQKDNYRPNGYSSTTTQINPDGSTT